MRARSSLECVPQYFLPSASAPGAGNPSLLYARGFGTDSPREGVRSFNGGNVSCAGHQRTGARRSDRADRYGNLAFRYAQMNFGPVMATAATLAVAEVRACSMTDAVRAGCSAGTLCRPCCRGRDMTMRSLNRLQIAWRAAQDIGDGMLVNLGMGHARECGDYLRPERYLHPVGDGVIAPGRRPPAAPIHLVDASSGVSRSARRSIVDSSWSFSPQFARPHRRRDFGAFEVAATAIWPIGHAPSNKGHCRGAMDLAACARAVWVIMDHLTAKVRRDARDVTLPLTACARQARLPILPSLKSRLPMVVPRCLKVSARRTCRSKPVTATLRRTAGAGGPAIELPIGTAS